MRRKVYYLALAGLVAGLTALADVDRRTAVVAAVEKALPGVVNISTEKIIQVLYNEPQMATRRALVDRFFDRFFGPSQSTGIQVKHSLGSGVVIHPAGYILSNYHVIERASRINVTLADGVTHVGRYIAGDPFADLALIKVDVGYPLPAVEFARGDDFMLGETVIVLGNPFGLSQTVTAGVLSSKNREAKYEGRVLYNDILQTDAAVNPGSSGGPLLDINGRLMGINVAIYEDAQNIGFAVPVSRVRELLAHWLAPQLLNNIWLGFDVAEQSNRLVVARTAARWAGLADWAREGDEVLAIDGQPVASVYDCYRALLTVQPGDRIRVRLRRAGAEIEIETPVAVVSDTVGAQYAWDRLGVELEESDAIQGVPGISSGGRYAISRVRPDSAASRAGLTPGQVVSKINGIDINARADLGVVLGVVHSGDPVTLELLTVQEAGAALIARASKVQLRAD